MAAARSAVYLRTTSLWGEGSTSGLGGYYFLRRVASTSLGRLLEKEAVRKRKVAAQGAVELLLWGVFFYSRGGGQIKSGAEHRRTEGKHRRNYFFSGVSGYYFCVGVVLADGGGRTHRPFGAIPLPFTIIF